ncbi:MAG: hypothetical protein AB8B84_04185 [Granulosicoccus sp.]
MSIFPESQTGIWLNTPIKFIDTRTEKKACVATNDADWHASSKDGIQQLKATDKELSAFFQNRAVPLRRSKPGDSARFHHNPSRTLYAHVKFNVVTESVGSLYFKSQVKEPSFKLAVLDLGCSQQLLRRYLKKAIAKFAYTGLDRTPLVYPDLVSDLTDKHSTEAFETVTPNTVFALDVLPELHSSEADLSQTLARWGEACRQSDPVFFFTVPQCAVSESDKLQLDFEQWMTLLERHFVIEQTRSLGFLSALPFWASNKRTVNNRGFVQRALHRLKEPMYESYVLKTFDLSLSRMLGNIKCLRKYSHSVLITAHVRQST